MANYLKTEGRKITSTSNLSVGMNLKKMDTFAKDIGFNVKEIVKKIKDTSDLQKKLDANWQGASRDAFVKDLNDAIGKVQRAVTAEYYDFMSRLQDLANNMYKEDKNLYKS